MHKVFNENAEWLKKGEAWCNGLEEQWNGIQLLN